MTDAYLRSLGFATTESEPDAGRPAFSHAWRYQHEQMTSDGHRLFIEHPLGIDSCRLSTMPAPLVPQDVFAAVALHDRSALETAICAFYAAHGGRGAVAPYQQAVPTTTAAPRLIYGRVVDFTTSDSSV
ncbi:hypothetical protein [Hymenobacter persicinus]|uniref:Uncharacterized protein n=1 Tax=Hymenobacter persicinus TaxID=2025506 RepID=A0A4Q5LDX7_9BACT|nr:hypothetical protein [Hymenobacter persicinus]RYU81878.1 hypothetical protein EWM57_05710 [Hymenobacter persicinus]